MNQHYSNCREENDIASDGRATNQKHYQIAAVQPIEIMQMYLSPEAFQGFLRGNALKYLLRVGHKDENMKEIDKAYQYVQWLRQAINGETINPRQND